MLSREELKLRDWRAKDGERSVGCRIRVARTSGPLVPTSCRHELSALVTWRCAPRCGGMRAQRFREPRYPRVPPIFDLRPSGLRLDELHAVTPGIGAEETADVGVIVIVARRVACRLQAIAQGVEIVGQERGVRFARGLEIWLDADVELQGAAAEPGTRAIAQGEGNFEFFQPKEIAVEGASRRLGIRRRGDLEVVESVDR